jgi:hypothetical protein
MSQPVLTPGAPSKEKSGFPRGFAPFLSVPPVTLKSQEAAGAGSTWGRTNRIIAVRAVGRGQWPSEG